MRVRQMPPDTIKKMLKKKKKQIIEQIIGAKLAEANKKHTGNWGNLRPEPRVNVQGFIKQNPFKVKPNTHTKFWGPRGMV